MPSRARGVAPLAVLAAALMACDAPVAVRVPEYVLQPSDVVISAASGELASPRGIALDSSGNLYVLDRMDRRIVVITPGGETRYIGGPGSGPGEFVVPLALGADVQNRVRVLDYQRQSVQVFSNTGVLLSERPIELTGLPSRITFGRDGRIAYSGTRPTRMGGLVAVHDSLGRAVSLIGSLISTQIEIPPTMLDQIHDNILPGFMRNNALPIFAEDGSLWLILQTEAILQRYTMDGAMVVEHRLSIPEMASIGSRYFEWYAAVETSDLLRYFEYVEDAVPVGDLLWLLWRTPEGDPALITLHDASGRMVARLTGPGMAAEAPPNELPGPPSRRRIAVDPGRSRLYLIDQVDVTMRSFSIPREIFATVKRGV